MAYTLKEGQGSLFKNEKQNDRQPDYKGTIVIGGTTYEIAAWERLSQRGLKYFSLQAAQPREKRDYSAFEPSVTESPSEGFRNAEELEDLPL